MYLKNFRTIIQQLVKLITKYKKQPKANKLLYVIIANKY